MNRFHAFWAALAMATTVLGGTALAADFYQGKTIKIVTGGSVGGGYDTQARTLANHIGKHIPGKPNVIVQNMPAGGGIASVNHTYAKAAKDGTELGGFNRNALFAKLLGHDQALFKLEEFNWLGSPASYSANAWVVMIRSNLPYKNLDDMRKAQKQIIFGNVRSVLIPVFREALGANIKIIEGYEGRQLDIALEQGEIDGMGSSYANIVRQHPDWIKDKKFRFIVQYGSGKRLPAQADVPTAVEAAKTEQDRDLIEFCELALTLGFPFAAPPGVPADRVAILRKAFDATVADPAYIAEAKKLKIETTPRSGAPLEAAVRKAAAAPPELITRYKRLAGESGDKT